MRVIIPMVVVVVAAFGVMRCAGIAAAAEEEGAAALPGAAEVIAAVREGERKVRDVRVEFEAWEERRDAAGEWARTPFRREGVAWFDGAQPGKARIHYSTIVVPWINGAGPELARSFDVGFDGKVGRVVGHTSGVPGNVGPLREARILPKAPTELHELAGSAATGKRFFLPFKRVGGQSFTAAAERYMAAGLEVGVAREDVDGVAAVRLAFGDPAKGRRLYWLDPARGYALLKHREEAEKGRLTEELVVKSLVEAAPGVWFPTEAYADLMRLDVEAMRKDRNSDRRTLVRHQFRALKVTINDPDFDPAVFVVPIPRDYDVTNEVPAGEDEGL